MLNRKFLASHLALILMSAEAGVAGTGADAAAAAPAAEKAPKAEKIQANGVTRPADGTKTGRVWAIADELSRAAGKPIARDKVMEKAKAESINEATTATQYGKWRVFNGLKGVSTSEPKPPKPAKVKGAAAGAEAPQVEQAPGAPAAQ